MVPAFFFHRRHLKFNGSALSLDELVQFVRRMPDYNTAIPTAINHGQQSLVKAALCAEMPAIAPFPQAASTGLYFANNCQGA